MGQPITVVEKAAPRPGFARFHLNRSLTGMGHVRYRSAEDATGIRPHDELARRLFARGGITRVHVFSNEVTVELEPGSDADGIADIIRDLFIHYREGVTPSIL